jgi:outer membrane immunogenic protein
MSKLLLATAAVAFAAVGSAGAADLPMKAPMMPVVAPVAYNWTGCYLGAGGGYGMWNQDSFFETDPGHVALTQTTTQGGRGWFATGQFGCDYQIAPSFVIGAFVDGDIGNIHANVSTIPLIAADEKESSSWAAGARVGWVALPQLLTFVSGGWTQAHFDQMNYTVNLAPAPFALPAFSAAHTYNGWFLGAGYEYGIGFMPGLFWKTEYRFGTYRADDLPILFANGTSTGFAVNSQKEIQTIRSELVWRFNWGGPVVARY